MFTVIAAVVYEDPVGAFSLGSKQDQHMVSSWKLVLLQ
jgi:hypothetical protein